MLRKNKATIQKGKKVVLLFDFLVLGQPELGKSSYLTFQMQLLAPKTSHFLSLRHFLLFFKLNTIQPPIQSNFISMSDFSTKDSIQSAAQTTTIHYNREINRYN